MASNRRHFIKQSLVGTGLVACSQFPYEAFAEQHATQKLSILHTNDVHSRLDPFPMDGSKYQGQGGAAARHQLIKNIRDEEEHLLLLDAGDIFQGTPYFNFYKGKPEMQVMSMMQYDAATIGNHDFDLGIENLALQMQYADFDFVNCNYDFTDTALEYIMKPYRIFRKGKLKIGILGVGIELVGLVPEKLYGNVKYRDPIEHANEVAEFLKNKKKCDYVICLSHLGFEYQDGKISDKILAKESSYINCIIGGHTHTFMDKPHITKNRKNQEVIINQVGWAGLQLGRINIYFNHKNDYDYVSNFTVLDVKETSV